VHFSVQVLRYFIPLLYTVTFRHFHFTLLIFHVHRRMLSLISYRMMIGWWVLCFLSLYVTLLTVFCYWLIECHVVKNIAMRKPTWIGERNAGQIARERTYLLAKYCCSLKVKRFPPKIVGWIRHCCWLWITWIINCKIVGFNVKWLMKTFRMHVIAIEPSQHIFNHHK